jgi:hypothetical protein
MNSPSMPFFAFLEEPDLMARTACNLSCARGLALKGLLKLFSAQNPITADAAI